MKFRSLMIIVLVALVHVSCVSEYEKILRSNDVDEKYKAALNYLTT